MKKVSAEPIAPGTALRTGLPLARTRGAPQRLYAVNTLECAPCSTRSHQRGPAASLWPSVGLPLFGSAYYKAPHELCEATARVLQAPRGPRAARTSDPRYAATRRLAHPEGRGDGGLKGCVS